MNNLEKREKILIFILIVALIGLLPYYYLTRNFMAENKVLKEELQVAEAQKEDYDYAKNNFNELEKQLSVLNKQVSALKLKGEDVEKSYDAHYIFTGFASKNNLKLQALNLGEPAPVDIGVDLPKTGRQPNKLTVELNVNGSMENILAFLGDIEKGGDNFVVEGFVTTDITDNAAVNAQITVGLYTALTKEERMGISGN